MRTQMSLFEDERTGEARGESVLMGRDRNALELLLGLHCVKAPRILDCTHNAGVMWKQTSYRPVRMDIAQCFEVDVVGDFCRMPFAEASFDVLVFDPPHLPNAQASSASWLGWETQYGCKGEGRPGNDVSSLFEPFLKEARRVLVPGGVLLAKIKDFVHNHRYRWQHVDFVAEVEKAGMTACDLLIKRDPVAGNIKSGRWKKSHHLRNCHCYWFVVRNGNKCEGKR